MRYIKAVIAPTEAPAIIDDNETSIAKTWSSNKINSELSDVIQMNKFVEMTTAKNFTINSSGYVGLGISAPADTTVVLALVTGWTSASGAFSLIPYLNTAYVVGTPNATVYNLKVKLIYVEN